MIIGVDVGKYATKVVYGDSKHERFRFLSKLYPYRELKGEVELDYDNFVVEYDDKKYFGGELGKREGKIPISYATESKYGLPTLINLLVALHRMKTNNFKIVIGSPISQRTQEEKNKLIKMIQGEHTITVNNKEKNIMIDQVAVSNEGAAGFWTQPMLGEIQGLDFGSTTINYFYFDNKRIVDKNSGTFPYGTENSLDSDLEGVMEGVYSQLASKFKKGNPTLLLGGYAETMLPYVRLYYPNAHLANDAIYDTAHGFYKIGEQLYG